MVKKFDLRSCSNKILKKIKKENEEELEIHYVPRCSNFNQFEEPETKKVKEISRKLVLKKRGNKIKTTPFIKEEEEDEDKVFNGGKELFIYLSILNDDDILAWYKLDPNGTFEGNQTQILSPISSISYNVIPNYYRTIGYDSKLYIMGGYKTRKDLDIGSKTFVCDTSSTNTWEESISMNSCKIGPQLAVVDGKIFAIGTLRLMNFKFKQPFAEVFDPSLNKWTALPSLPSDIHIYCVANSVFVRDQDEIIIFPSDYSSPKPHYAYRFNVKSHSWARFSDPFKIPADCTTSSVAVGNVIFRLQKENRLYACDMSHPKPIGRRVYGLEKEIKSFMSNTGHLFYIGNGKLCLIWSFKSKEHRDMKVIACLKFWVGMCNEKRRLEAVIDRCDHYLVNGRSILRDCVAM
ncbi:hypothetical protein AQUCO_06800035v1 [Aquilegia coerulea]|uniref:FKB95-like N-terminal Kelch domain-containing protein n=1 Tax=Aquilegia coerulea TaxID=218851 RepID=A0A2G5CBD3_AQUCA|nr:hypothetical protein AQUCO_06800035v1 [Aquilegia coerulea]